MYFRNAGRTIGMIILSNIFQASQQHCCITAAGMLRQSKVIAMTSYQALISSCVSFEIQANCTFYSPASLEDCKLMRAFAQLNFLQLVVRSRGKWSRCQQGGDSQICYYFLILISLILFVNLTMESSDSINEGKKDLQVLLEK